MITLLASVGGGNSVYSAESIGEVLEHPRTLYHNAEFTGRPATRLFATDKHVAKLRADFDFQKESAEKCAVSALDADRRLNAYHPDKTWFIHEAETGLWVGNIAPRLRTLHRALPALVGRNDELALDKFRKLLYLYCRTAKNTQRRLDEGLSNFGWDKSGEVYYLDDDSYIWDDLTNLSGILNIWVRQLHATDVEFAHRMGLLLAEVIPNVFTASNALHVLLDSLRDTVTVSSRERNCIQAIAETIADVVYLDTKHRNETGEERQT